MKYLHSKPLLSLLMLFGVFLCAHGRASATPACSITAPSLTDAIASYDVFSTVSGAPSYGPYYIAPGGTTASSTFTFKCAGNFTPTGSTTNVTVFFYGTGTSSYTQPFLSGPAGSKLNFALCLPTKTCTSLTDANVWNATSGYTVNNVAKNQVVDIPQTQIYVPPATAASNNVYVGTSTAYTQTINFFFMCSGYGSC